MIEQPLNDLGTSASYVGSSFPQDYIEDIRAKVNLQNVGELAFDIVEDYQPGVAFTQWAFIHRTRPPFSREVVPEMLTDPLINFGLRLLRGPIRTQTKFDIETQHPDVEQFVNNTLKRFWADGLGTALRSLEWGWAAGEVKYQFSNGLWVYSGMQTFHPKDTRALTAKGKFCGFRLDNHNFGQDRNLYLGGMKAFWTVHNRERNRWYGLSRLFDCYSAWHELWSNGGFQDIRQLWYYKNCFDGGAMRYPEGSTRLADGRIVANKSLAREMMEKRRAGATLVVPDRLSSNGRDYAWTYEPPTALSTPSGLLEYGEALEMKVLQGLGIPPEVVQSTSDQGFGAASGRQIPFIAFYSCLHEITTPILLDFVEQVVRPLVWLNFGPDSYFEATVGSYLDAPITTLQAGQEHANSPITQAENDKFDDDEENPDEDLLPKTEAA